MWRFTSFFLICWLQLFSFASANDSASTTTSSGSTSGGSTSVSQLVDLLPFDVQLTLAASSSSSTIDASELRKRVQEWLSISFIANTEALAFEFDRILLDDITPRRRRSRRLRQGAASTATDRQLQTTTDTNTNTNSEETLNVVVVATYKGVSIWKPDFEIPSANKVADLQLSAILSAEATLTELLQAASTEKGLGDNLLAASVNINRNVDNNNNNNNGNNSSSNDRLNTVIIVAIVIAALACLLLMFAVFMAWYQSKQRADAYKTTSSKKHGAGGGGSGSSPTKSSKTNTDTDLTATPNKKYDEPPSVVGQHVDMGGLYPESVISEDISTSLNAYYKSGMPSSGGGGGGYDDFRGGGLNDAASVSSMESYGYSLDGYASTIGGGGTTTDKSSLKK